MKIFVLFGQRFCEYDEQYAPEALEVADEYTMDENPDWMEERFSSIESDGEFSSLAVVEVNLNDHAETVINRALNNHPSVNGSVEET